MVSSRRNDGTITQELRYPFAGTAVQFRQESSGKEFYRQSMAAYDGIIKYKILDVQK